MSGDSSRNVAIFAQNCSFFNILDAFPLECGVFCANPQGQLIPCGQRHYCSGDEFIVLLHVSKDSLLRKRKKKEKDKRKKEKEKKQKKKGKRRIRLRFKNNNQNNSKKAKRRNWRLVRSILRGALRTSLVCFCMLRNSFTLEEK